MPEQGYLISRATADALRKLFKQSPPIQTIGREGTPARSAPPVIYKFLAIIGGNAGTFGWAPLKYAFQEGYEDTTGAVVVKPGGIVSDTTLQPAINRYEISGQPIAPIANGTLVDMEKTIDASGIPKFRFYLVQLPTLGVGQGWYGNSTGSLTTIVADDLRAV